MSLDLWYPILGWEKRPNFGNCHTMQDLKEFSNNYKETYDLNKFRRNLLENLTGQFEQINIRILGNPGSGKTSFIYSLLKTLAENGDQRLLEKYVFYIFHVNRALGDGADEIVQENIRLAWGKYFDAVGLSQNFSSINKQKISLKEKLNLCVDYFKGNREKFSSKVLIYVIDDADLLEPKEIRDIACSVIKHVELSSVKKWLVLRNETYEKYDSEVRNTIDSFFPDMRKFPRLSLYDIITHRISSPAVGTSSKNPFSTALCESVSKLFDGNLRESLSALQSILSDVSPINLKSTTAEEFIQNYIDKASIPSLVKSEHIYNIHLPHLRNVPLPIPLDVVCLLRYVNDPVMLLNTVNHAINVRWSKYKKASDADSISVKPHQLEFTLNALVTMGLVRLDHASYFLTYKGEALSIYAPRTYYTDTALAGVDKQGLTEKYQLMCYAEVDHQSVINTWLLS
jgi:Cdc6-like AAA superfamily ATPase